MRKLRRRPAGAIAVCWRSVRRAACGGSAAEYPNAMVQTSEGGYIVVGSTNSVDGDVVGNNGGSDYWIIKLDKDGNEQWQKTIGSSGDDQLYAVHTTKDGHYLLGGNSNSEPGEDKRSSNENGTDFWVVKLDKDNKDILWQETYNIAKVDILTWKTGLDQYMEKFQE